MSQQTIDLLDLFGVAAQAIQQNRTQLNKADTYNGNHGDNMAEIMEVVQQAMREKKNADVPSQLEYAAQLVRQKSNSGSANVLAGGLAQAAQQFLGGQTQNKSKGSGIPMDLALSLLMTILNGGNKSQSSGSQDLVGSLLGSLVTGMSGSQKPAASSKQGGGADLLSMGLDLLQASQEAGIDVGQLAQTLVSGTEMGKSDHRAQSGQLIANAALKMLMANMAKGK
ncbi:MAG: hypothetical protein KIS85_01085 [Anaerolineales bacterium]|nr:hypothetical protein [Anaerolineales bacterium]